MNCEIKDDYPLMQRSHGKNVMRSRKRNKVYSSQKDRLRKYENIKDCNAVRRNLHSPLSESASMSFKSAKNAKSGKTSNRGNTALPNIPPCTESCMKSITIANSKDNQDFRLSCKYDANKITTAQKTQESVLGICLAQGNSKRVLESGGCLDIRRSTENECNLFYKNSNQSPKETSHYTSKSNGRAIMEGRFCKLSNYSTK